MTLRARRHHRRDHGSITIARFTYPVELLRHRLMNEVRVQNGLKVPKRWALRWVGQGGIRVLQFSVVVLLHYGGVTVGVAFWESTSPIELLLVLQLADF